MDPVSGWAWEIARNTMLDKTCLPHRSLFGGRFAAWGYMGDYALVLTDKPEPPTTPQGWYAIPYGSEGAPMPRKVKPITLGEGVVVMSRYCHNTYIIHDNQPEELRWSEPKPTFLFHVTVYYRDTVPANQDQ